MKYIFTMMLSLFSASSLYAESLNLFIQNSSSNSTIVVEKQDGMKITVEPNSKVQDVAFERNSQVKNYVDGRHVCTWVVNDEGIPPDWTLTGLEYDYEGGHICGRIATKVIDTAELRKDLLHDAVITLLKDWDLRHSIESQGATIFHELLVCSNYEIILALFDGQQF